MKTAAEWRREYYYTRGKTVHPCTLLGDILQDLEERESERESLYARIRYLEQELDDLERALEANT